MTCPKCGYPQICGCESCAPRLAEKIEPYIVTPDGEGYTCANCGFTAGADEWLTFEGEVLKSTNPHFSWVVAVSKFQIIADVQR